MLPHVRTLGLVLIVSMFLSGCIVISDRQSETVSLPEGRYTGAIRAATTVSFSSDRAATYKTIAAKQDLEECDQQRLVYALARDSGHSSDKADVVVALAENPSVTPSTRALIGKHAESLASFSSDRNRIAAALAK